MADNCPRCDIEWYRPYAGEIEMLYCLQCSAYYSPDTLPGVYIYHAKDRGKEAIWAIGKHGIGEERYIAASVDEDSESVWKHILRTDRP